MKALDIPTDLLRTLVTVIDCQSYTRAAEILGCSQPTVSLHMRRLQDHADGELVLPKRKPVELTALGTQLASYARRILALHGELSYLTEENTGSETVRVGLPTDYATDALQSSLLTLRGSHPGLSLEFRCALSQSISQNFAAGGLDIAVAIDPGALNPYRSHTWTVQPLWVTGRSFEQASGQPVPLIAHPKGCEYRLRMTEVLDSAGIAWYVIYESPFIQGLQHAVESGLGVSALTQPTLTKKMKELPQDIDFAQMRAITIGLFSRNTPARPEVSLVLNHLQQVFDTKRPPKRLNRTSHPK
tara:strand:- start:1503 stop:2405 length:903 start_codon:yes stop_codon:yes gene_type:complete